MADTRVSQYERRTNPPYVCLMRPPSRLLAILIVVAAVASCQKPPSKSGGELGTATIHAPTGDPNTPGGDLMEHVRSQLGTVSNGAFDVITGGMPDPSVVDAERASIELVRNGEADISIVPRQRSHPRVTRRSRRCKPRC